MTYGPLGNVLVSGGIRPAGTVTRAQGPAPVVGGLTMPFIKLVWPSDVANFYVHAPVVCGPGTHWAAQFGEATASASGPGFTTQLPSVGGGDDPATAENSFTFGPFPSEATTVTLKAPVQVRACNGTEVGAVVGAGTAVWQVSLPAYSPAAGTKGG